ncbi:hypothetical protein QUB70_00935 [Microcoleus sp. A003_D6]|uniref:hypothetical protein n=1 Tax=Microcoleus sp. A003_D6 TaxID=3055266 RepID=UPI002FD3A8F7
MSKFEELCKAYATSRQAYRESCQACLDFSEIFLNQMSDYLECAIEKQNQKFDEDGVLHFDGAIDVCENPENPEKGDRETVTIYLSVNKVIDNFIVNVYPWGRDFKILIDEPRHFEEAFEYIFDTLQSAYTGASQLPSEPDPVPF